MNKFIAISTIAATAMTFNLASAIPAVSLSSSDTNIGVGDVFEVTVSVSDIDSSLGGLFAWGFWVDPFSALSKIGYIGTSVLSPFSAIENSTGSIIADDWSISTFGAANIDLATLSFLALAAGSENLLVEGLSDGMYGLYFEDPINGNVSFSESLNLKIKARAVPDEMSLSGVGMAVLAVFIFFRRVKGSASSQSGEAIQV